VVLVLERNNFKGVIEDGDRNILIVLASTYVISKSGRLEAVLNTHLTIFERELA